MKPDILNREDIILLVNTFYEKVQEDNTIGFIFNTIAQVNWDKHLPIMYDFWENTLFFRGSYSGNPVKLHTHLHHLMPLTKVHFDQWNSLFTETVDDLFEGEKANLAKQRAQSISLVLQQKLAQANSLEQVFNQKTS